MRSFSCTSRSDAEKVISQEIVLQPLRLGEVLGDRISGNENRIDHGLFSVRPVGYFGSGYSRDCGRLFVVGRILIARISCQDAIETRGKTVP
jgi:hypothetical protein